MRKHRVDGLLVSMSKNTDSYEHFEALKKYSIPIVFFDRVPDMADAYTVSCNLKDSSSKLVDWLVARELLRIGFIKGPEAMLPSQERLTGYLEGLKRNNLPLDEAYIVQTDLTKEKNLAAMARLLSLPQKPTAVIAFNDYVALDVIKYCRKEGMKINKDIFFVSYANLPVTSYLHDRPVASVEQFPYEQAEKATEILLRLIADKDVLKLMHRTILETKVICDQELP